MQTQSPQLARLFKGMPVMLGDFNQLIGLMQSNEQIFVQVPGGLEHDPRCKATSTTSSRSTACRAAGAHA